jgi:hypothetical protein
MISVKSEHMNDGQWMSGGHEPDTFRYGYNGNSMDSSYAGPENYTAAPPTLEGHNINSYDYQMRQSVSQPPPPLGKKECYG